MLLYISFLCFASALGDPGKEPELKWPERYSVQAVRISLTSGIIEDYKAWKTNSSSRIDYNQGAVKTIILTNNVEGSPNGIKYQINPATIDGETNEMMCRMENGTDYLPKVLESILPFVDTTKLKQAGDEPIMDENTIKFFSKDVTSKSDSRITLWVKYDEEQNIWIPVKYEIITYSTWLGSLFKHDIWDFYNFNVDVDESVFSTDEYECMENPFGIPDTKELNLIDPENDNHVDHIFNSYKTMFNRKYAHEKEKALRKNIFQKKLRLIMSTNRKNVGYKLTINKFADRTPEEMKRYRGLRRRPDGKVGTVPFPYTEQKINDMAKDLPAEYDLRILGYVSKIKDQEECGSCWTFGTTAALEGALARNNGRLIALSNQALVDCTWSFGAAGCDGGSDNAAYEWMMKFGLPTEAEYGPYMNRDGFCRIHNMTKKYPIRGFTDVTPFSIGALKVAVINHGPLSVSVHVTDTFSLYSGGVFYDTNCTTSKLNHEVTLVGYGERDDDTFWILKNSWGPSWGVDGYMLISARDNNCGVATEPTYVVL